MAGFEVSTYGRFWVSTEGHQHQADEECENYGEAEKPPCAYRVDSERSHGWAWRHGTGTPAYDQLCASESTR
jgi:hypothetical protein